MSSEFPKLITSSVVRGSEKGQSHGGVYIVDFASQTVDEADTISLFMYSARAGSLDLAAVARTRGAFSGER